MSHVASYYAATANSLREYAPLDGDTGADVCVIGGGYTGLSAALHLRRAGFDVVLLESQRFGWGASGRNGGQLYGGQRRTVDWLESRFGAKRADQLWRIGDEARALVKALIDEHGIDCDLTPGVAVVAHRERYVAGYHTLVDKLGERYGERHLEKLDRDACRALIGTDAYFGGYVDWESAHLHPLNLALGMVDACRGAGVRLHESTQATGIRSRSKVQVDTSAGRVEARFAVLAVNGYLGGLAPKIGGRIMPINNFMVATEPLAAERLARINPRCVAVGDSRFVINYFRTSADGRLLFGGGESYRQRFPRDIAGFVRPRMLAIYPELTDVAIEYAWGGTLAITMSRMPHFGRLEPGIYFAQGYSGQGIAMAHLAGKYIADAIAGDTGRFDVMAALPASMFPGGRWLRWPGLVLGMSYFALRDRL